MASSPTLHDRPALAGGLRGTPQKPGRGACLPPKPAVSRLHGRLSDASFFLLASPWLVALLCWHKWCEWKGIDPLSWE